MKAWTTTEHARALRRVHRLACRAAELAYEARELMKAVGEDDIADDARALQDVAWNLRDRAKGGVDALAEQEAERSPKESR